MRYIHILATASVYYTILVAAAPTPTLNYNSASSTRTTTSTSQTPVTPPPQYVIPPPERTVTPPPSYVDTKRWSKVNKELGDIIAQAPHGAPFDSEEVAKYLENLVKTLGPMFESARRLGAMRDHGLPFPPSPPEFTPPRHFSTAAEVNECRRAIQRWVDWSNLIDELTVGELLGTTGSGHDTQ